MQGGHREPKVFCGAFRGRYKINGVRQDHKMKIAGLTDQQLELRFDGKSNSLTTVQKDNVIVRTATINKGGQGDRIYSSQGKAITLSAQSGGTAGSGNMLVGDEYTWRKLTPLECERLQTLPDNYTQGVSDTQRYKMIGNGWTVDVIAHILKNLA